MHVAFSICGWPISFWANSLRQNHKAHVLEHIIGSRLLNAVGRRRSLWTQTVSRFSWRSGKQWVISTCTYNIHPGDRRKKRDNSVQREKHQLLRAHNRVCFVIRSCLSFESLVTAQQHQYFFMVRSAKFSVHIWDYFFCLRNESETV